MSRYNDAKQILDTEPRASFNLNDYLNKVEEMAGNVFSMVKILKSENARLKEEIQQLRQELESYE